MIDALTSGQAAEVAKPKLAFIVFVLLDWELSPADEVTLGHTRYLCSAMRDFEWDGHTWRGMGALASIEPITETASNEITGTRLVLPSASLSTRAQILQQKIQGTECKVWVAPVDDDEQLIDSPILEYRGFLDTPELSDNVDATGLVVSTSVAVTVEGIMVDFKRTGRYRRYTDRDQRQMYPSDGYCRFVGALKEKALGWGIPGGPR
jgi:hypothetical protein